MGNQPVLLSQWSEAPHSAARKCGPRVGITKTELDTKKSSRTNTGGGKKIVKPKALTIFLVFTSGVTERFLFRFWEVFLLFLTRDRKRERRSAKDKKVWRKKNNAIEFLPHVRERETGDGGGIERGRERGGGGETENLMAKGNAAGGKKICPSSPPPPPREREVGRAREREGGRAIERERGKKGRREG